MLKKNNQKGYFLVELLFIFMIIGTTIILSSDLITKCQQMLAEVKATA